METACIIRKSQIDSRIFYICREGPRQKCSFFKAADEPGTDGMCVFNLDRAETKGSAEEITDFCFNAECWAAARERIK